MKLKDLAPTKRILVLLVLLGVTFSFMPFIPYKILYALGDSMRPSLPSGCLVIIQTGFFDTYHLASGTIVTYTYNSSISVMHRILRIEFSHGKQVYICKGDNNQCADPLPVYPENITAILVLVLWKP